MAVLSLTVLGNLTDNLNTYPSQFNRQSDEYLRVFVGVFE
jgi:hypothetical protein